MKANQKSSTSTQSEVPATTASDRGRGSGRGNAFAQERMASQQSVSRGALDGGTGQAPVAPAGGAGEKSADDLAIQVLAQMSGAGGAATAGPGSAPRGDTGRGPDPAEAISSAFAKAESAFGEIRPVSGAGAGQVHRSEGPVTEASSATPERFGTLPASMIAAFRALTGIDVSRFQLVVGGRADELAGPMGAEAFAYGGKVFVPEGSYAPGTLEGDRLLAHEVAHLVLGHGGGQAHRFVAEERDQISTLDQVIETAEQIADDTGMAGLMRWGRFTAAAGGSGAWEALTGETESQANLAHRYLYTRRTGLVDMRHFYQMMYIALLQGNESATERGRQHELDAEAGSRFAPEDTTSNALGAWFGSQRDIFQLQSTFTEELRDLLERLEPVDFTALDPADQDAIVAFYSERNEDGTPTHANETAHPELPRIALHEGQDASLPYTVGEDGRTIVSLESSTNPNFGDRSTRDASGTADSDAPGVDAPDLETAPTTEPVIHVVQSGDTLSAIAARYLGSPGRYMEIFEHNTDVLTNPNQIRPGQELRIPGLTRPAAPAATDATAPTTDAAAPTTTDAGGADRIVHVVQSGDTLTAIARRYLGDGDRYMEIYENNRDVLSSPHALRPGQELVITGSRATTSDTSTEPAQPTGTAEGHSEQSRETVLQAAASHLGAPYYWGGNGPTYFDCSGFALYVLREDTRLIDWPDDTAAGIAARLPETHAPEMGDLVFFRWGGSIVHVEIVTGRGSQTIGASGGGSTTYGDDPAAKVQYGSWTSDGRDYFFGSIASLLTTGAVA